MKILEFRGLKYDIDEDYLDDLSEALSKCGTSLEVMFRELNAKGMTEFLKMLETYHAYSEFASYIMNWVKEPYMSFEYWSDTVERLCEYEKTYTKECRKCKFSFHQDIMEECCHTTNEHDCDERCSKLCGSCASEFLTMREMSENH